MTYRTCMVQTVHVGAEIANLDMTAGFWDGTMENVGFTGKISHPICMGLRCMLDWHRCHIRVLCDVTLGSWFQASKPQSWLSESQQQQYQMMQLRLRIYMGVWYHRLTRLTLLCSPTIKEYKFKRVHESPIVNFHM